MRGLFVTGTDTGVGKTWVGCALARQLTDRGIRVVPRKPVESGCKLENGRLMPADAKALLDAATYKGSLDEVCPLRFEAAISPERAARLINQPLTIDQLADACPRGTSAEDDFLLVEGAGGFYSPLCEDGLNADLAQALGLPVLLVAEDRLGCINQVLLNLQAIEARQLNLLAVILNDPAGASLDHPEMDNFNDLSQRLSYPVFNTRQKQGELPGGLIDVLL